MAELASLLPIIGIFLIFWLLLIRPAQRRQKQLREFQHRLEVGHRVVTSGGIFGTIAHLDDDRVGLEVADGVVVTVARQAIGGLAHDVETGSPDQPTTEQE